MKSIQQVLGYLEGWRKAISSDDPKDNEENSVYRVLSDIINYIEPNKQEDTITSIYDGNQYIKTIPVDDANGIITTKGRNGTANAYSRPPVYQSQNR